MIVYFCVRKERSTRPAYRTTNNDLPVVNIQPASHHRPSIVDSGAKPIHAPVKSFKQCRQSVQLSSSLMPAVGSLKSVCPGTVSEASTQVSFSNPVVGAAPEQTLPQTRRMPPSHIKAAATMPPSYVAETNADYMLRFRLTSCVLSCYSHWSQYDHAS
jgi:hypothetical protein